MSFNAENYNEIRNGCQRSAATVVPLIMSLLNPRTVADLGCGEGWWLREFAAHGCTVWGVDGHDGQDLPFTYHAVDLEATPYVDLGPVDLVLCLEVAEHLSAARADFLVRALTASSDTILFSAAIPGQGGIGHINEQPPRYWADRFNAHGYQVTGALRWLLWEQDVENWYAQNLMLVAANPPAGLAHLFEGPAAEPLHVIHPVLWASRQ